MSKFLQSIHAIYPPNNTPIFEEWFRYYYYGCETDRELIPALFTGYWVNNNYGNDKPSFNDMQAMVDSLDRKKKWFTCIQYDDGALIDFKDLDVIQFNMSKRYDVPIPLLCRPHPYSFSSPKKYFASFIGSRTHPIRNHLDKLGYLEGYLISFENTDIQTYCRILHESMFALCPRGYGISSFRIAEAIQYGAIPVYISDEFAFPTNSEDFCGIMINEKDVENINEILENIDPIEVVAMQEKLQSFYDKYYTYEGCMNNIIKPYLEAEYNTRKQVRTITPINPDIDATGVDRV